MRVARSSSRRGVSPRSCKQATSHSSVARVAKINGQRRGVEFQVDTDQRTRALSCGYLVFPVTEVLEQDFSEAPWPSGRVMGLAEFVDISTPRGVVSGSSATQVAPHPLPIWRDQEIPDEGVHPPRVPQQQLFARQRLAEDR